MKNDMSDRSVNTEIKKAPTNGKVIQSLYGMQKQITEDFSVAYKKMRK